MSDEPRDNDSLEEGDPGPIPIEVVPAVPVPEPGDPGAIPTADVMHGRLIGEYIERGDPDEPEPPQEPGDPGTIETVDLDEAQNPDND